MSKISDLREAREAAGRRCLAAYQAFCEVHIDLIALDAAMATLAGELPAFRIEMQPDGAEHPSLFSWVTTEASSRYAEYVSYRPATANWHTDIQARRDAYIAAASQA